MRREARRAAGRDEGVRATPPHSFTSIRVCHLRSKTLPSRGSGITPVTLGEINKGQTGCCCYRYRMGAYARMCVHYTSVMWTLACVSNVLRMTIITLHWWAVRPVELEISSGWPTSGQNSTCIWDLCSCEHIMWFQNGSLCGICKLSNGLAKTEWCVEVQHYCTNLGLYCRGMYVSMLICWVESKKKTV